MGHWAGHYLVNKVPFSDMPLVVGELPAPISMGSAISTTEWLFVCSHLSSQKWCHDLCLWFGLCAQRMLLNKQARCGDWGGMNAVMLGSQSAESHYTSAYVLPSILHHRLGQILSRVGRVGHRWAEHRWQSTLQTTEWHSTEICLGIRNKWQLPMLHLHLTRGLVDASSFLGFAEMSKQVIEKYRMNPSHMAKIKW